MTTADLIEIPAGAFQMGADDAPHPEDGEGPAREVWLDAYQIGATTVTNADFAAFVTATGYVTQAETTGGSLVFRGQLAAPDDHPVAATAAPWWRWVKGASWRYPNGAEAPPGLPVVHIAFEDARAYCNWAGQRLPTEAEWERAAGPSRGLPLRIFEGRFPDAPSRPPFPAPSADGPANAFGLIHACGNVWEWTADRFTRLHSPRPTHNPAGPLNGSERIVKGGSFLCAPSYCARYRPSSRRGETPEATTSHMGFRVAV